MPSLPNVKVSVRPRTSTSPKIASMAEFLWPLSRCRKGGEKRSYTRLMPLSVRLIRSESLSIAAKCATQRGGETVLASRPGRPTGREDGRLAGSKGTDCLLSAAGVHAGRASSAPSSASLPCNHVSDERLTFSASEARTFSRLMAASQSLWQAEPIVSIEFTCLIIFGSVTPTLLQRAHLYSQLFSLQAAGRQERAGRPIVRQGGGNRRRTFRRRFTRV